MNHSVVVFKHMQVLVQILMNIYCLMKQKLIL